MSEKPKIAVGLIIAVIILTVPFWYVLAAGRPDSPPELDLPEGQCVEDVEYMRANHMDLLNQWRDAVVRHGDQEQVEVDGQKYHKSLTRGCMTCHTSRESFCARCHNYADVHPTCWECHVESNEN